MGQSTSRRRTPPPEPQPTVESPSARRSRTLRNSLLSILNNNDASGTSTRRASRRWSRAAVPKPETVVQPDAEGVVEDTDTVSEVQDDPREPVGRPRTPLATTTTTTTVTPPAPPDPGPPPMQGFPPAGTVVLVQGVVQTTSEPVRPPTPSQTTANSQHIEVLGTLLTVAAQATAASLLSGSTPPSNSTSPTAPQTRRSPWNALRERLGPTALPPPTATPVSTPPSTPTSPQDERSRMLAEMARAFNVGLGLSAPSGSNSSSSASEESSNSNEPPAPLPEEGTFDRFLVDLQSDLRVTLAPRRDDDELPLTIPLPPSPSLEPVDSGDDADVPEESHDVVPEAEETPVGDTSATTASPSAEGEAEQEASISHRAGTGPGAVNWWRLYRFPAIPVATRTSDIAPSSAASATDTAPALPEDAIAAAPIPASESHSSSSSEPSSSSSSSSATTPAARTVVPVIVVGLQSVPGGTAALTGFPGPLPAHGHPHSDSPGQPDGTASSGSAEASSEGAVVTEPISAAVVEEDRASRRRSWWRPRSRVDPPANVALATSEAETETTEEAEGLVVEEGATNPEQQASESSTAPPEPVPPRPSAPGLSRTFLIYVIGGFYPPHHALLTSGGTPESFEALLELGELLHLRPPTASKADIARAGLAVVRREELAGLSVTASCTEKCLICLDDYADDDPIRVLGCRHAFHQGCVDKWLETGRNNCPACRTRGVPTAPAQMSTSVPAASETTAPAPVTPSPA
ncbi:RING finger protein [Mycena chlorophos]|uniref:RING finger protein n=1 Tax=Mycena chlorophos TaxID=658473 RepID=A0A8H6S5C9_MYCCL|nr:RING finger protein [Mycena chlorophos]